MKKTQWINLVLGVAISLIFVLQWSACKQAPYTHGKILYDKFCAQCHQDDGAALRKLIPPLANSDYLVNHKDQLACLIRYGIKGKMVVNGITYDKEMPPIPEFSDIEIANVINYINASWGNNNGYTSLKDVQDALEKCDSK